MKSSKTLLLILLITLTIYSCDTDNDNKSYAYDTPIILSPENNSEFYSHEQFIISWELPEGINNSEIQIIESLTPIDNSNTSAFNNATSSGGNQPTYTFAYGYEITEPIYIGFRVRAMDFEENIGYSDWTEIRSFKITPLVSLNKQTVEVFYDFDFITEEINHEYYSGVIESENYTLSNIAIENNLDLNKIKVVRPVNVYASFLTLMDDGRNPFHPITFGYSDDPLQNNSVYPFLVLGQVSPGSYQESPIQSQLYNEQHVNLTEELKLYNLKMAYLLVDEPNTQHVVQLHFTLDIYSEY